MADKKYHPTTIKKAEKYANIDSKYGLFEEIGNEFGEPIGVPTDDKEVVKGLGKMLGKLDKDGQLNEIALVNEFIDKQIAIFTKSKIYNTIEERCC